MSFPARGGRHEVGLPADLPESAQVESTDDGVVRGEPGGSHAVELHSELENMGTVTSNINYSNVGGQQLPPNQQRTLNKLPTELRCGNFVNKHRLSTQIGAKRAKTCVKFGHTPTETLILHTTVDGWAAIERPFPLVCT